jgi:rod shape-determining protein MreC
MGQVLRKWWRVMVAAALLTAAIHLFVRPPPATGTAELVRSFTSSLFRPVYATVDTFRQSASAVWVRYVALTGLARENEELKREIETLRARIGENREAILENRRLKELLAFSGKIEKRTLGARVIGHDAYPWFHALFIDAGTERGVTPGMAVVAPAGGVGRIYKTYRDFSVVLLLTDGRFAADVIVERTRARFIAEGMGKGLSRLKYVSPTQGVAIGDRILFSGFDGSMPKGILLGTVAGVEVPRKGLFLEVKVQGAVNYRELEEVLVVLSPPSVPFGGAR